MANNNYRDMANEWFDKLPADSELLSELRAIDKDEILEDSFYKSLEFGTAGLRGKIGVGTNRMNVYTVGKAIQGIASFIKEQGREYCAKGVVIAHDPRHYSKEFARLAARIMAAAGIKVFTFPDLRPTPQLAYMIRRLGTTAGVNITASHNPKEYNGCKIYWNDGCQVSQEIADAMTEEISKTNIWEDIKQKDFDIAVKDGDIIILGPEYDREYLDKVESLSIHDGSQLDLNIPIVYTPLNGCGSKPFRTMLTERGFNNWLIVDEQSEPDPDFTTVGYPNPEDPKSFRLSEEYGRKINAEVLLSTDPDADRFAIEIRNKEGNYIPLNGNQTGYLLVNYILEGHKESGTLPSNGAMIKSIVTSTLSTRIAQAYGVKMFETLTGFKNICGKIPYLHENGYNYLFGYEESVGYAACEDIRDKDGISAGMLVAEAAAYYRKQGLTLWDVLQNIYAKYGYFAEDEPNLILEGIPGAERIKRMMTWFRSNIPSHVAGSKVSQVIDYIDGYEDLLPHNCIRIFLENGSWFAVRPSGTEPKIKFYFYSVQDSREKALRVNESIKNEIIGIIKSVK